MRVSAEDLSCCWPITMHLPHHDISPLLPPAATLFLHSSHRPTCDLIFPHSPPSNLLSHHSTAREQQGSLATQGNRRMETPRAPHSLEQHVSIPGLRCTSPNRRHYDIGGWRSGDDCAEWKFSSEFSLDCPTKRLCAWNPRPPYTGPQLPSTA